MYARIQIQWQVTQRNKKASHVAFKLKHLGIFLKVKYSSKNEKKNADNIPSIQTVAFILC